MMAQIAVFVLGALLAIQGFAALFLIVDLGYAAQRYRYRIAGPILGWWLSIVVVYIALPPGCQMAYIYGVIAMIALQVTGFFVARLLMSLAFRRR